MISLHRGHTGSKSNNFQPRLQVDPEHYNDRKWDSDRALELAARHGQPVVYRTAVSARERHWDPYSAARDPHSAPWAKRVEPRVQRLLEEDRRAHQKHVTSVAVRNGDTAPVKGNALPTYAAAEATQRLKLKRVDAASERRSHPSIQSAPATTAITVERQSSKQQANERPGEKAKENK
eukprot:6204170-Pleurochrysis_carterae.AAC.1